MNNANLRRLKILELKMKKPKQTVGIFLFDDEKKIIFHEDKEYSFDGTEPSKAEVIHKISNEMGYEIVFSVPTVDSDPFKDLACPPND